MSFWEVGSISKNDGSAIDRTTPGIITANDANELNAVSLSTYEKIAV